MVVDGGTIMMQLIRLHGVQWVDRSVAGCRVTRLAISVKSFPALQGVGTYRPTAIMAGNFQDKIILFGDSLTQRSWDPLWGGIGARLASTSNPTHVASTVTFQLTTW